MCGIYFSVSPGRIPAEPSRRHRDLLDARGPDSQRRHLVKTVYPGGRHFTSYFYATVLSLRGPVTVQQPVVDQETGCVLCWNGEAWMIREEVVTENDTRRVFALLMDAVCSRQHERRSCDDVEQQWEYGVTQALRSITGPYAFVFYDAVNKRVHYGRDRLGRRSLLVKQDQNSFILSSVSDGTPGWSEVEPDGVYVLDVDGHPDLKLHRQSWDSEQYQLKVNPEVPPQEGPPLLADQHAGPVLKLEALLRSAMELRICSIPDLAGASHPHPPSEGTRGAADASQVTSPLHTDSEPTNTPLAILFSGGLDCTVLARLAHDLLPPSLSIDLLNVAFENPRLSNSPRPAGKSQYDLCPDRITARSSLAELQRICPTRAWRLIEIDVPYPEAQQHRRTIVELMSPHDTEMDLSIALALYFAARGTGTTTSSTGPSQHATTARVLLSGLGADELFGGYVRHATAFRHRGHAGLLGELQLDYARLGTRNLGRDDRVISHWGKEARYPYLDEGVVEWAVRARVDEKCGFGMREATNDKRDDSADGERLEPGKLVLRLLARKLGLENVSREKKRAIQFGARTAKMEGKAVGTAKIKSGRDGSDVDAASVAL